MAQSKPAVRRRTIRRSFPKSSGSTPKAITSTIPNRKLDAFSARIALWSIDTRLARLAAKTKNLETAKNDLRMEMFLREVPDLVLHTSSQNSTRGSKTDESDSATLSDRTAIFDDTDHNHHYNSRNTEVYTTKAAHHVELGVDEGGAGEEGDDKGGAGEGGDDKGGDDKGEAGEGGDDERGEDENTTSWAEIPVSANLPAIQQLPAMKRPGKRATQVINTQMANLDIGTTIVDPANPTLKDPKDLESVDHQSGSSNHTQAPNLSIGNQAANAPSAIDTTNETYAPALSIGDHAAGAPSGIDTNNDLSIGDRGVEPKDLEDFAQPQSIPSNPARGTSEPGEIESSQDILSTIPNTPVDTEGEASPQSVAEGVDVADQNRLEWTEVELARIAERRVQLRLEREVLLERLGMTRSHIIIVPNTCNDAIDLTDDNDQDDDSPTDLTSDGDDGDDNPSRVMEPIRYIMGPVKRSFDEYMQNEMVSAADALRFAEELKDRVRTQRGKMMKMSGMGN
ncbi:uncharacterized protein PAC_14770 [Phialocephala subalpina]|uniref:Uncharacterized protein n=1 Tax=Phialocephala subalpina TaxID=576137 RepID=A0A1L7XIL3_9HELO|nr:uncharacterized protein PAC_14770 [Phialocephala subalpina]